MEIKENTVHSYYKEFTIQNCYEEEYKVKVDLDKVRTIILLTISGDELLYVVYKNGDIETFDSDTHYRSMGYFDDMTILFPETTNKQTDYILEEGKWIKE